ncbi:blast:U6 snRNA-associated Sm-like protein LSm4 [Drosophila guanche]|uniref:Blast:U6 snRNA-associated Sm-like protein LSm4 n=1 Tax=Drosophila guanche TaxID=7266 RepID=A0A3B0K6H4_DROGU|nr:blast:U6 snRNA-associated Sm-like protein LSm4 [Drosophila guanche]
MVRNFSLVIYSIRKFDIKCLILIISVYIHIQLVELKNGETYNGHLVSCDSWMNINLRDVICTSKVNNKIV